MCKRPRCVRTGVHARRFHSAVFRRAPCRHALCPRKGRHRKCLLTQICTHVSVCIHTHVQGGAVQENHTDIHDFLVLAYGQSDDESASDKASPKLQLPRDDPHDCCSPSAQDSGQPRSQEVLFMDKDHASERVADSAVRLPKIATDVRKGGGEKGGAGKALQGRGGAKLLAAAFAGKAKRKGDIVGKHKEEASRVVDESANRSNLAPRHGFVLFALRASTKLSHVHLENMSAACIFTKRHLS
jgi:hypothetical protein